MIFLASSKVRPTAPVFDTFSLPAKSTKLSVPFLINFSFLKDWVTSNMSIQWLLLELWFNLVSATFLLDWDKSTYSKNSSMEDKYTSLRPSITIPVSGFSWILISALCCVSKSYMTSL